MSKAQQMCDDLRKRHDYDLLECEALPLFDAIDALQQSHDRLLKAAEAVKEHHSPYNSGGPLTPAVLSRVRDAIEKAREV